MMNVTEATMKELLAFYNENAEKPVKRFADRKTAERRVSALMEEMDGPEVFTPDAPARGKVVVEAPRAASATRSEAIARSWEDEETRAARSQRSAVEVDGHYYGSVRKAFIALDLPMKLHIAFRGELKAAGELDAYDHHWEIVPLNYGQEEA